MKLFGTLVLATIALATFALGITEAAAQTRKPGRPIGTQEQRMKICDMNNMSCDSGCDDLIDIDNNISNCRAQCDARYSRCQRWAKTQAMIVLPTDGKGQLQSVCSRVGGDFDDGGGFLAACTKQDCDGKGGVCDVVCPTLASCTAKTPSPLSGAQTLLSILQNGQKVFRDPGQSAGGSLVQSDGSPPAAPPVILY